MTEAFYVLKSMLKNGIIWNKCISRLKEDYYFSDEEIGEAIDEYEDSFYIDNELVSYPEVDDIEI